MNDEIKLNKKLKKIVNNFFNINVDELEFITKTLYSEEYICLIYSCKSCKRRIFGVVITDENLITFGELMSGYNPVIFVEYNDELLKLAFNLYSGMVLVEYKDDKTRIDTTSCNPENLKYGNREFVYDGKMFDVDKVLIVSKLEGFLV